MNFVNTMMTTKENYRGLMNNRKQPDISDAEAQRRIDEMREKEQAERALNSLQFWRFKEALPVGMVFPARLGIAGPGANSSCPNYTIHKTTFRIKQLYPWIAIVETRLNMRGDIVKFTATINLKDYWQERNNLVIIPHRREVIA